MISRLLRALQEALLPRWMNRLPLILFEAEALDEGMSSSEAYTKGYRKAYWDAMVDMAESGLVREPPHIPTKIRGSSIPWMSEEVH